jgi:hypothetical protein
MHGGISIDLGKLYYCVLNSYLLKEGYHIVFCQSIHTYFCQTSERLFHALTTLSLTFLTYYSPLSRQ